jgi:8-oxo-dGTP pyrophosphatase MutT (NUDIX family)
MNFDYGSGAIAFAIAGYLWFLSVIILNKAKLSVQTWFLMGILNLITLIVLWMMSVNVGALVVYTIGTIVVFVAMMAEGAEVSWTKADTLVCCLIGTCLLSWIVIGKEATSIVGPISCGLANIPQLKHCRKFPERSTAAIWIVFLLANICFLMGAQSWEIRHTLYQLIAIPLCTIFACLNFRRDKSQLLLEMIDLFDQRVLRPISDLKFRPSAYGVYIDNGEVLLVPNKQNGKLGFPGGGIELHETAMAAVIRESHEEIGTKNVRDLRIVDILENYFYYNPINGPTETFHTVLIFYQGVVDRSEVSDTQDEFEGPPTWYKIEDLKEEQFPKLVSGSFLEIIKKTLSI